MELSIFFIIVLAIFIPPPENPGLLSPGMNGITRTRTDACICPSSFGMLGA